MTATIDYAQLFLLSVAGATILCAWFAMRGMGRGGGGWR